MRAFHRSKDPTIDSVAAAAGVSTATVSRFFNEPAMLSADTAARVRKVVDAMAYVPNRLAGALASSRTRVVATVIPTLSNSIFASTVQGLSDSLALHGFGVVLALSGVNDEHFKRQLMSIMGHRPDGIILTGAVPDPAIRARLEVSGIPTIETWDLPADPIDMVVGFSHEAVGRAVGRYVVKTGRRRILIVSAGGPRALARRAGFAKVLRNNGIPLPTVASFPGPTTYGHGRLAVAEHVNATTRPNLVLCSSDWAAHGAMDELRRKRLRIPEDVAVIGFGDLDFAAELDPALTTVKIDGNAIGAHAASLLMKRAQGERVREKIVDVGFELVVRASSPPDLAGTMTARPRGSAKIRGRPIRGPDS